MEQTSTFTVFWKVYGTSTSQLITSHVINNVKIIVIQFSF